MRLFSKKNLIFNPCDGVVFPLEEVKDPVFSGKIMGDGFAVKPSNGEVFSPISGKVSSIFTTKHAITIVTENGLTALIHMGIDTVNLKGEAFNILVTEGQEVTFQTQIAKVDLEKIEASNLQKTIIIVFPEVNITKIDVDFGLKKHSEQIGKVAFK